jgi:CDP-2,3-bis-(O-geranylgeranyl)-sn-glycerol synthase
MAIRSRGVTLLSGNDNTLLVFIGQCVWYILPAYLANMAPLMTAMALKQRFAYPLDFGLTLGGEPVLGAHKTFRGLLAGLAVAVTVASVQAWLYQRPPIRTLSLLPYDQVHPAWWGLLMGAGAIAGDALKSFVKRRLGIPPGQPWIPFDQIDFLIGALALTSIAFTPPWSVVAGILIVMPVIKVLVAHAAYRVGLRPTAW